MQNKELNMNKYLTLIYFIVFPWIILTAQENEFTQKISLSSYFGSPSYNNHSLIYSNKIELPYNSDIIDVKFTNYKTLAVNIENISTLRDTEQIEDTFIFDWSIRTERKKNYLHFWVTPLRKNMRTNIYEFLQQFTIKYQVKPKLALKNDNTNTLNTSLLASGNWFKIKVNKTGVYKLSYDNLLEIGIENPEDVRVFSYGGKQLPYANAEKNYDDMNEIPIKMVTGSDNNFNSGDYILFYAEGPVTWTYDPGLDLFLNERHLYSHYIYLFLSASFGAGKRIETIDNTDLTADYTTQTYDSYQYHEEDNFNLIGSGREWYGEKFRPNESMNFEFTFPNLVTSQAVKIYASVAGRRESTSPVSYFKLSQDNVAVGNIQISQAYGKYTYAYAYERTFEITSTDNTLNLNLAYLGGNASSDGYLNCLCLNARENIVVNNNQVTFRDKNTRNQGNTIAYKIKTNQNTITVWDITNSELPIEIKTQKNGTEFLFKQNNDTLHEFIGFADNTFLTPIISGDDLGKVENQNLHGIGMFDMLIISHPNFLQYAEKLAELRRTQDNLSVYVTTPQIIYNEFSSGTPDISAIRNFIRMLYQRAENENDMLKYVLLFGDGSYDNRTMTNNSNFIPTYQSQTSLSETASFVSDDFYGLLDPTEGGSSGALDIGIGRFPVQTTAEAQAMLDKINSYESNESKGDWRSRICFIGDDGDSSQHMKQPDEIADKLKITHPQLNIQKIYLDAFEQISTPAGQRCPDATTAINEQMNQGALIVDYVGHGNPRILTHEEILSVNDVRKWKNLNRLPIFVTASCEVGRYDNYEETSLGEWIVLNPDGGGIAALTTTRVVYSTGNHELNTNFFNVVFNDNFRLGDIIRSAKANTSGETNKRNFSLLGDPSLKLAMPRKTNYISAINGKTPTIRNHKSDDTIKLDSRAIIDTLKALELAQVSGYVIDSSGDLITEDGVLDVTVFDKARTLTTLGDEVISPINFTLQNTVLYKGKASVNQGFFNFQFIIPKDINYAFGTGKISLYAAMENSDAIGYSNDIIIGGSNENAQNDFTGPDISLFINDSNFVNYGTTGQDPILIAHLTDESGINTTGNGFGHNITAVIDNDPDKVFILNNFYTGDMNKYNQGKIAYPIYDLATGDHTIELKAWDIYNNSNTAQIHFTIYNNNEIVIENLTNSPNPFSDKTTFLFEHNQAFTDASIKIDIFDIYGKKVAHLEQSGYQSGNISNTMQWNGTNFNGAKLANGLYVYKLELELDTGTKTTKSSKMMIFK